MMSIEEITQLAIRAHSGQKDMIGNPAILHVLAVGLMGETEQEKKAGFLHDVVEDTDLTTHRDGISYEDYVRNIVASGNETAIHVKLNDLRQNIGRAADSILTLESCGRRDDALLREIVRIAALHGWAEQYILSAVPA